MPEKTVKDLTSEVQELRAQLEEAQETLNAIRRGEIDGLVVSTPKGEQIYTLSGAETPYRLLIEEMKEGALMLSDDNTILYANKGFAKIVKHPLIEIVGKNIENIIAPIHLSTFKEILFMSRARKVVVENQIALKAKDNSLVPVHVSVALLTKNDPKTTLLIATDLTQHMEEQLKSYTINLEKEIKERKKAEENLKEYQTNLERIVEERTKQLKDSERLAAIGATAGMVGHDIRNPLQAISGDLYLAKEGLASCSDNEGKKEVLESIIEIEKNIDYINKIVQDLQDYARPLNPNSGEVDLKLIVGKLLEKNGLPENVKVNVEVDDEARKFVSDSDYLNRILFNLVTNAVQAMPKGGKLSIHAYKDKKYIVICVTDNGVGIPKEIQSKMFTPMFTTKAKGQGFGLPVVKRMTEALGGTVTFESQEGKGTTFTVRFPQPQNTLR
jgi:PAS domain S-box-containing protein